MHTLTIKSAERNFQAVEGGDVMVVTVEVFRDEESLGERKFNYPLETTEEAIMSDLEKYKTTLDSDYEVAQKSKALEEGLANVENLNKSLTGKTL